MAPPSGWWPGRRRTGWGDRAAPVPDGRGSNGRYLDWGGRPFHKCSLCVLLVMVTILWLKRDLRVADNPALALAAGSRALSCRFTSWSRRNGRSLTGRPVNGASSPRALPAARGSGASRRAAAGAHGRRGDSAGGAARGTWRGPAGQPRGDRQPLDLRARPAGGGLGARATGWRGGRCRSRASRAGCRTGAAGRRGATRRCGRIGGTARGPRAARAGPRADPRCQRSGPWLRPLSGPAERRARARAGPAGQFPDRARQGLSRRHVLAPVGAGVPVRACRRIWPTARCRRARWCRRWRRAAGRWMRRNAR